MILSQTFRLQITFNQKARELVIKKIYVHLERLKTPHPHPNQCAFRRLKRVIQQTQWSCTPEDWQQWMTCQRHTDMVHCTTHVIVSDVGDWYQTLARYGGASHALVLKCYWLIICLFLCSWAIRLCTRPHNKGKLLPSKRCWNTVLIPMLWLRLVKSVCSSNFSTCFVLYWTECISCVH